MSQSQPIPDSKVLKAFGIEPHTELERLSGGRGTVYRAGDAVLKRVDVSLEMLQWLAATFETLHTTHRCDSKEEHDIRLRTPIVGHLEDGYVSLVIDDWTAWKWLDGISSETLGPLLEPVDSASAESQGLDVPYDPTRTYKWDHIIAAGKCFSTLMREHQIPKPALLEARKDPWGLADQIAWNELSLEKEMKIEVHVDNKVHHVLSGPHWRTEAKYLGEALDNLHYLDQDPTQNLVDDEPSQIIHGDLTGNVLFCLPLTDTSPPPGIIDISPYFRPPSFSTAIVVVDALACENAPVEWAMNYLKNGKQMKMFARALIFRIVADYLLIVTGDSHVGDDYTRPMQVLRIVLV